MSQSVTRRAPGGLGVERDGRHPAPWGSNRGSLRSLLDSPNAVFGVDLEHRIVVWNTAAERLLGRPADEVLGRPCYDIIAGEVPGVGFCSATCLAIMRARQDRVGAAQTMAFRGADGVRRWLSVTHVLVPAPQEGMTLLVHVLRDVTKEVEASQLLEEVKRLLDSPNGAEEAQQKAPVSASGGLTGRERAVLELLARGYSTSAIAAELGLHPTTVRNHIQHALAKVGAHNRTEAVVYAFHHGLLETPSNWRPRPTRRRDVREKAARALARGQDQPDHDDNKMGDIREEQRGRDFG